MSKRTALSTVLLLMFALSLLLCVSGFGLSFTLSKVRRTGLDNVRSSSDNSRLGQSKPSNPSTAQAIVHLLKTRYGADFKSTKDSSCWKKTKNYIYQGTMRGLTVEQAEGVLDFLDKTFPDDPELIRRILQTVPRILRKNVRTSLEPTAQFLLQLYGQAMFEEAITRNPLLLLTSGVEVGPDNKDLQIYLEEKLGMSRPAVMRLQKKAPSLFRLSLAKIESIVDYFLELLARGDFDESESTKIVCKMISTYPYLMALSLKDNLQPRIEFLKERCGLSDRQIGTLFKSNASILGLSVSENLRPTLNFLSELLQQPRMSDKDLLHLVQKCIMGNPSILASSLKNLQSKVKYFDAIDRLGVDKDEAIGGDTTSLAARVAIRAPVVYSLSLKANIVPTVEFLAKVWAAPCPIGESFEVSADQQETFDDDDDDNRSWSLSSMLKEHPAVLSLSLEGNIQPTMNFYNRTGYTLLDSDWNLQAHKLPKKKGMSASPIRARDISMSLFNRLLPRWQYWLANQSLDDEAESSATLPFYLLAGVADRAFCERLGFDYDDYIEFKEESVPRLKFSSQFDTWVKTGRPIDESLSRF